MKSIFQSIHAWHVCLLVSLFLNISPFALASHPFHVATAETKWNLETGRLEVSIRCHPIDLETALGKIAGKKVDLDKTENVDALLTTYLEQNFKIHQGSLPADPQNDKPSTLEPTALPSAADLNSANQKTTTQNLAAKDIDQSLAKLHWVGKEVDLKWAWLYIEIEPADLEQELHLTNTILMDVLDDQSNTVIIRLGNQRQSLMFNQKKRTFPFPRPKDFAQKP
jgi:hypothetical protein